MRYERPSRVTLERLVERENRSDYEIAQMLGCSHQTIYRLRAYYRISAARANGGAVVPLTERKLPPALRKYKPRECHEPGAYVQKTDVDSTIAAFHDVYGPYADMKLKPVR